MYRTIVVLSLLSVQLLFAQPGQQIDFPNTPQGKTADAYFEAFRDSSGASMKEFMETHISQEGLKQVPFEIRLQRFKQMRGMFRTLTPRRLLEAQETSLRLIASTATGEQLLMEFLFEKAPAYGLLGIRIDQADDEIGERAKDEQALVALVKELLAASVKADEFSGVVMIAKNGNPIFQEAYQLADKELKAPNTILTRFNVGSINKHFTSLIIHQLVSAGQLSFNDTIKKFLPDYPNPQAAEKVTVRHLLDMTSGIGDFFGERFQSTPKNTLATISSYLPLFADKPLEFEPGSQSRYSNGGYIVLGAIIEKVTGLDYYTVVKKRLYQPAGMTSSDWFERTSTSPLNAKGYTKSTNNGTEDSIRRINTEFLPQRGSSAGGGYSTAGDLLKYVSAMQNDTLVPASFDGQSGFGIAGGTAGVNAVLDWDPRSGYTVIVLSNYDPPSAQKIAKKIRGWLPK